MTTDPTTTSLAAAVPAPAVPAAAVSATPGSLAAVPRLLRSDPVLAALIGAADATVAVPEAAQSVVAAALAAFTERTPLLVITATGLDAERLGDDLSCLIATEDDPAEDLEAGGVVGARLVGSGHRAAGVGDPAVRAGEPRDRDDGPAAGGAARPGRRRRTPVAAVHRPRVDGRAGVRAVLRAARARSSGTAPDRHPPGAAVSTWRSCCPRLVADGVPARAPRWSTAASSPWCAAGSWTCSPPTADEPVRIDLWGDEVESG